MITCEGRQTQAYPTTKPGEWKTPHLVVLKLMWIVRVHFRWVLSADFPDGRQPPIGRNIKRKLREIVVSEDSNFHGWGTWTEMDKPPLLRAALDYWHYKEYGSFETGLKTLASIAALLLCYSVLRNWTRISALGWLAEIITECHPINFVPVYSLTKYSL